MRILSVFSHDSHLYAFRPYELEAIADRGTDRSALEALGLEPWKASPQSRWDAAPPLLLNDPLVPSSLRFVVVQPNGDVAVVEPSTRSVLLGGPHRTTTDIPREGPAIVRYPKIDASGSRQPGTSLLLTIDLARAADAETSSDPLVFDNLPDDWRRLPVSVVVTSPQLAFAAGGNEGTILVRRDTPSVACVIPATVTDAGAQRIDVTATFSRDDRWCGTARRTFTLDSDAATTGSVSFANGAVAPDLTVHIHRDPLSPERLHWLVFPAIQHRGLLDDDPSGELRLDAAPGAFVRTLFRVAGGAQRGEHVGILRGIGEQLWGRTPAFFRTSYWKLRDALGDGFSIQFLSDDPWIPWELMRPVRAGVKDTVLLAESHPVARGLLAYPNRLRPILPSSGERLTVAPDYRRRTPPLPALVDAIDESTTLQERFHAKRIDPPTARSLLDVLEDGLGTPVQLLHFAGHGALADDALFSSIALQDVDLRVAQVRSQDVVLGEKYKTFVILNACEVGATVDVLGAIGGWAEALAYRDFSGFIAPLWAVFDGHAKIVLEKLLAAILVDKRRLGEALRDVRREYGGESPTFLSYVYYGDVNARFG